VPESSKAVLSGREMRSPFYSSGTLVTAHDLL
jgi:hypothetical protein